MAVEHARRQVQILSLTFRILQVTNRVSQRQVSLAAQMAANEVGLNARPTTERHQ